MKKIFLTTILLAGFMGFSQDVELPENAKTGDCFMRIKENKNFKEFKKVDCELLDIFKKGELETLQIKLQNLGYKIEPTKVIDNKTIRAFKKFKKDRKKKRK